MLEPKFSVNQQYYDHLDILCSDQGLKGVSEHSRSLIHYWNVHVGSHRNVAQSYTFTNRA